MKLLELIDAALAEASAGTSTLIKRDECVDILLDLRTAADTHYTLQSLEADFLRKAQRRLR